MGKISDLFVKLKLKNEEFDKGVDQSKKKVGGFASSLKKFGGILAGAFALGKVVTFFKESFKLYGIQEDAERKLRAQIEANGKAATSTLNDYKKFASGIQDLTTVGDEATLQMIQIAESMGSTTEQSKEAAKGAIGLSKAFGIGLDAALRGVILAQKGQFEMLNRYIPALRTANNDVEKAAILQKAMADGFKVAQAEVSVATGRLQQLSNAWGDFKEQVGKGIAKSQQFDVIVGLLELMVGKTGDLKTEQDKANEGAQNLFSAWKSGGKLTKEFLIERIQLLKDENKEVKSNGNLLKEGSVARLKGNNALIALLREDLKIQEQQGREAEKGAKKQIDLIISVKDEIKAKQELSDEGSMENRANINAEIESLTTYLSLLKIVGTEAAKIKPAKLATIADLPDFKVGEVAGGDINKKKADRIKEELQKGTEDAEAKRQEFAAKQQSFNEQAAMLAESFIADTVTVFAEGIGDLLSGDFDIENFGQALLSTIGNFLVDMGKMLIAYGIGMQAFKDAFSNPFAAIAAGVALVAIGSAISKKAAAGPGGGGGGAITSIDTRGSGTGGGANNRTAINQALPQAVQVEVVGTISNKTIALSNAQGTKDLRR